MEDRNDKGPNHATTPSLVDSDDRCDVGAGGGDAHCCTAGSWTDAWLDDAGMTVSAVGVVNVRMDLGDFGTYLTTDKLKTSLCEQQVKPVLFQLWLSSYSYS